MDESRVTKNKEMVKGIERENRKDKNKIVFKVLFWFFMPTFIFFAFSYTMLRFVGNMGLVVKEYPMYYDNLPINLDGLKIVQFSDIHYNQYSSLTKIQDMVDLINKANPDLVVFTGDLIDKDYIPSSSEIDTLIKELNRIRAKVGKYTIKGEEDDTYFKNTFDNTDFIVLDNTIEKIYIDSSVIDLIAVDELYDASSISGRNIDNFGITLVHKPDLTDRIIDDFSPNVIMAGHSHNGQVMLPLIGSVMHKEGAKKYYSSYYKVRNTDLFISSGIGNSYYQFRLFNHPSINFYRMRVSK